MNKKGQVQAVAILALALFLAIIAIGGGIGGIVGLWKIFTNPWFKYGTIAVLILALDHFLLKGIVLGSIIKLFGRFR